MFQYKLNTNVLIIDDIIHGIVLALARMTENEES